MYLLMGFSISIVTILGMTLLGYKILVFEKNFKPLLITSTIASIVYGLVLWIWFWSWQSGIYGPAPMSLEIIIGCVISVIIILAFSPRYNEDYSEFVIKWKKLPALYIILIYGAYTVIWVVFLQSTIFTSSQRANLIGDVKVVKSISDVIMPADNKHICQVPKEIASTYAQAALSQLKLDDNVVAGSRYDIAKEPTKQYVDGAYWWIYPLEFNGYWTWKEDKQVPGYIRVSAEDPSRPAQVVQEDTNGKKISIKYLNSACFDNRAERYLRKNGYLNTILADWTFEVDDQWRPFYTVTVLERKYGYSGNVVKGIILFDIQSGESKILPVKKVPKWVDRIYPLEAVIDPNVYNWGMFKHASFLNAIKFDQTKSQVPTPGWYMTYDEKEGCQWFTGFTSVNEEDNALTGLMVVNARTGQAKFYKTSGVTEQLAITAAKGMWAAATSAYKPTELVPYNIYGLLTYVVPMKYGNQFVGISLVSLDIDIKASGPDMESALRNYRQAISNSKKGSLAPQSGMPEAVQLNGVIERVGVPLINGKSIIFSFKLKNVGKMFQVGYSDTNPESILMQAGDSVVITYDETTETTVSISSFDIINVKLDKGSVTQAKALENKKVVDAETERVSDQQKIDTIINSSQLQDVDPAALQKLLDEQSKQ